MYLHKSVSDHIERTYAPERYPAVPLAHLITSHETVDELGLFDSKGNCVGRFDLLYVKVRTDTALYASTPLATRPLVLYFGALHVATFTRVKVNGRRRYEVTRGRYGYLRFDIDRGPVVTRLDRLTA